MCSSGYNIIQCLLCSITSFRELEHLVEHNFKTFVKEKNGLSADMIIWPCRCLIIILFCYILEVAGSRYTVKGHRGAGWPLSVISRGSEYVGTLRGK